MKELILTPQKLLDPWSKVDLRLFIVAEEDKHFSLLFSISSDSFSRKYHC